MVKINDLQKPYLQVFVYFYAPSTTPHILYFFCFQFIIWSIKINIRPIKKQVNKLSISFLEQMDKLIQDNEEKIDSIILNQNDLNKKILKMEKQLEEIESDIYMDESTEVNVS